MASVARRFGSGIALVVLALSAYLAARGVGIILQDLVAVVPPSPQAGGGPSSDSGGELPRRDLSTATARNIFGARRDRDAIPEVTTPGRGGSGGERASGLPVTTLPLRLVGTTVFEDPTSSLATILDTRAKRSTIHSVNRCRRQTPAPQAGGSQGSPAEPCREVDERAVVLTIHRDRVILHNRETDRRERLELGRAAAPTISVAAVSAAPSRRSTSDSGVRQVGDRSYVVPRGAIEPLLANPAAVSGLRVQPHVSDGRIDGYRLFAVRPGTLPAQLGLQNGDVVKGVNGYPLDDPARLLELYAKLRETSSVSLDLDRRGQPTTLDYRVRD